MTNAFETSDLRVCPSCGELRKRGSTRCWTCNDETPFAACLPSAQPNHPPQTEPREASRASGGDKILDRLRAANVTELRGIAEALNVQLVGDRDIDVVSLSKEYRSAAGNSFANIFRGDHELPYRVILEDVVIAAGELAGFRRVAAAASAHDEWLEQYVVTAMSFVERARERTPSDEERFRAQRVAEDALHGRLGDVGMDLGEAASLGALAAGFVAVALGVVALPFGIAHVALKWSRPAMKKTLPATMWLIAVRKRLERESDEEAEELLRLLAEVDALSFVDGFVSPFAAAHVAFRASDLEEAMRCAMHAREWMLKALELGTRAHAKFPHEPVFATLYSAAKGTLPVVDEFLSDVRAFKELVDIEPPESAKVASERETLLQKIGAILRKLET